MRTDPPCFRRHKKVRGVTLIELLAFLVIVGIALASLLSVLAFQVSNSVDPVARVRALEKGQAMLDEILSRNFDENTPTGGVPACDSPEGDPCAGILRNHSELDDVGDYDGYEKDEEGLYRLNVKVEPAGAHLGIDDQQARLITVTVDVPGNGALTLSAYRVNF